MLRIPAWPLALLILLVLVACHGGALAYPAHQEEARGWVEGADYDPDVPSPSIVLGHPLGSSPASIPAVVAYAGLLARSSDRVQLEELGTSTEGDPLLLLVITAADAQAGLADRSERLRLLADARAQKEERRAARAASRPAVWIGCSVHGDEASGVDAGLWLAYHLAADRSPATTEILQRTVVLIDPCQNPDGRRRFLQFERSFTRIGDGPDPSPYAIEHTQMWPGGRYNHYFFDLNRDWAFLTQSETRARVAGFLRWRPQVFVDLHEMGRRSSYFFPPPSEPINPNVPESVLDWFDTFGRANAKVFEERGYDYFVRETYDLFYPGYGDSWPTLQGAVGMTFEQASTRGRSLVQRAGRVVGYADAVAHHYVAARATIETAGRYADDLMQSVVDFYQQTRRRADRDSRREVLFSVAAHPHAARHLAELLHSQGIEVLRTREDARLRLAPYDSAGTQAVELPAGSFRVKLRQADYALLRSLVDPETTLDRRFLAQEEERRRRGLQNRFYDVTAWSLVYSYGVEAWWSKDDLDVDSEVFVADSAPEAEAVPGDQGTYAWLIDYRDPDDVACLSDLWNEGIVVATSLEDFTLDGHIFSRGALIIPRATNADVPQLASKLQSIAAAHGSQLLSTATGWSQAGPSLGSSQVRFLSAPRVGLLTGPGLRSVSAGAASWLLEQRYRVHFTSLLLESLGEVDLRDFDVLLLPEIESSTELPLARLRSWVEGGGVLVAVGTAASALLDGEEDFGSLRVIDDLADLADEDGMLGDFQVGPPGDEELLPDDRRVLGTPGAILRVDVDPTHPLSLGEAGRVWAPYLSDRLLLPSVAGSNVITVAAENACASGFMWPVMKEAVAGKAYLVEERIDRGAVIFFAEDPAFRGVWEGLHRFLLNSLLIRPSLLSE